MDSLIELSDAINSARLSRTTIHANWCVTSLNMRPGSHAGLAASLKKMLPMKKSPRLSTLAPLNFVRVVDEVEMTRESATLIGGFNQFPVGQGAREHHRRQVRPDARQRNRRRAEPRLRSARASCCHVVTLLQSSRLGAACRIAAADLPRPQAICRVPGD